MQKQNYKKIPPNLKNILQQNKQKMTAIQNNIKTFWEKRSKIKKLQYFQIEEFQDENEITNALVYKIIIKGRENTYYQLRYLVFYIVFYDNYPQDPPQIIAPYIYNNMHQVYTPFLHLNINPKGQVCTKINQLNNQYYSYTLLIDILLQLQNLIYQPNIASSYDNRLYQAYRNEKVSNQYYKILIQQSKFLQRIKNQDISQYDKQ